MKLNMLPAAVKCLSDGFMAALPVLLPNPQCLIIIELVGSY